MDVIIDDKVHETLLEFYEVSKRLHITLDDVTVSNKMKRIFDELENLGNYATVYNTARLHTSWIQKGYRECIIEDFHFAFTIYQDEYGEPYVRVHEACHSYLYKE